MPPTRKLIEVALPLEAINTASAREKSIRHGHPSTLHLWWARRPLAACRAVLFASLVDDPSSHPDRFPTEDAQQRERERLFGMIERLVKWENSNNEHVLREAREEILKHTNGNPPPVYDPFAGGGSIPLEAQRLGLEAHASDLNPVAVLINKALIEIPPKFANMPPVNPESRKQEVENSEGEHAFQLTVRLFSESVHESESQRKGTTMTTVTEIKTAITQLTSEELRELRTWYEQFDAAQWDIQIEADVAAGRLDALADEAIRDFQAGTATEL